MSSCQNKSVSSPGQTPSAICMQQTALWLKKQKIKKKTVWSQSAHQPTQSRQIIDGQTDTGDRRRTQTDRDEKIQGCRGDS